MLSPHSDRLILPTSRNYRTCCHAPLIIIEHVITPHWAKTSSVHQKSHGDKTEQHHGLVGRAVRERCSVTSKEGRQLHTVDGPCWAFLTPLLPLGTSGGGGSLCLSTNIQPNRAGQLKDRQNQSRQIKQGKRQTPKQTTQYFNSHQKQKGGDIHTAKCW